MSFGDSQIIREQKLSEKFLFALGSWGPKLQRCAVRISESDMGRAHI